jgi:hypothetical protein
VPRDGLEVRRLGWSGTARKTVREARLRGIVTVTTLSREAKYENIPLPPQLPLNRTGRHKQAANTNKQIEVVRGGNGTTLLLGKE